MAVSVSVILRPLPLAIFCIFTVRQHTINRNLGDAACLVCRISQWEMSRRRRGVTHILATAPFLNFIYRATLISVPISRVGQNHIDILYTHRIHKIYGREITEYTVIYGVHIRFWPTLPISLVSISS